MTNSERRRPKYEENSPKMLKGVLQQEIILRNEFAPLEWYLKSFNQNFQFHIIIDKHKLFCIFASMGQSLGLGNTKKGQSLDTHKF